MKRGWRKLILLVEDLQPVGVGEPAGAAPVSVLVHAPRAAGPAPAPFLLHGVRLLPPQLNLNVERALRHISPFLQRRTKMWDCFAKQQLGSGATF